MYRLVGVLLAAGCSRRFGGDKLMHPLENGTAIALSAARNLIAAVPESIAVIREQHQELASALSLSGFKVIQNPRAEEGMGTSLAVGTKAMIDADGWLIALADMPWVKTETIQALSDEMEQGASMVAPIFQQKRGHPVGFSSDWRNDLLGLCGDQGARHLLDEHVDALRLLTTNDPGVLRDIDVPGDLLRHSFGS